MQPHLGEISEVRRQHQDIGSASEVRMRQELVVVHVDVFRWRAERVVAEMQRGTGERKAIPENATSTFR